MLVGTGRVNDYGNPFGNAAFNRDVVNAVDRFESRDNLVVGEAAQGGNVLLAADAEEHDRENVRGQSQDIGFAGIVGQGKTADAAPDFLLRVLHIGAGNEVGGHQGEIARGNRGDFLQVGHSDDEILHLGGHIGSDG